MVRLKVVSFGNFNTIQMVFQFHYGTIKSPKHQSRSPHLHIFQFHYGTIKSARRLTFCHRNDKFQFHYGTIKRERKHSDTTIIKISIPLWYD